MKTYNDINIDFFENQSEDLAYFLGFAMGDGCLHTEKDKYKKTVFTLSCNNKDEYILEHFLKNIAPDRHVYRHDYTTINKLKRTRSYIRISDKNLNKYLLKYNIVPQKTGKERIPSILQKKYYPDFLRGYFDSDGSIRQKNFTVSICAAEKRIFDQIVDYLKIGKIYFDKRCNGCYTYEITNRSDVTFFGKIIYYDKNVICLKRKLNIFNDMPKPLVFESKGKFKTLKNWWNESDQKISYDTFKNRVLKNNLNIELALSLPKFDTKSGRLYKKNTNKRIKLQKMMKCSIFDYPKIKRL